MEFYAQLYFVMFDVAICISFISLSVFVWFT